MTPALELLNRCRVLGVALRRNGSRLAASPAGRVSPDLLAQLRAHKPALLLLLEAEAAQLPLDCAPWLHTARQVLAGEFDPGTRSLLESLLIGLRNIPHPNCRQARARLDLLLGSHREARR